MLRVVGIVVDGGHGAHLVISPGEHPFMVHVGEPHRTNNLFHAAVTSPLLHGVEKRVANLGVVNEFYETEAHGRLSGALVDNVVDDAGDAPYGFAVAVGHERLGLAEVKRGVLVGAERVDVVLQQRGNEAGVPFIVVHTEFDKFGEFFLGRFYWNDFYCHRGQ